MTIELTLIKLINKIDRVNELWKTSLNLDITRLQINFNIIINCQNIKVPGTKFIVPGLTQIIIKILFLLNYIKLK